MEQEIRFCTAHDGVRIAYSTVGEGPPLIKAANWLTHLEYDWDSPVWKGWLREMAQRYQLIRYDERGCGLSDWNVGDFSFEAWVQDLETVVDTLGLDKFPLLGISQGGAVAIAYAVRHPEKVTKLILYGAYAQGRLRSNSSPEEAEEHNALTTLIKLGWGKDNPAFREVFTNLFMPEATPEQKNWLTELQQKTTSPENAVKFHEVFGNVDVLELLSQVTTPTLVLHARQDCRIPLNAGRQLAATIPGARFVLLESKNHILRDTEPAFRRFIDEIFDFINLDTNASMNEKSTLPSSELKAGQEVSNYKILEKIGSGGMALVYKARDQRLDRLVALKFLPLHFGSGDDFRKRFISEAKAASALDHQNICTIYEIDQTENGQLFIAMAFYEGETLEQKLARGPISRKDAIDYILQAGEGLKTAHESGIIHRDIKPANIMITEKGVVKIVDFGVAKMTDVNLTRTGTALGTLAYMSPEQIRAETIDARTDLWSIGVVLYEMLAGERPFKADYEQAVLYEILNEEPPPISDKCGDVSEEIASVLTKLLAKNPNDLYQSIEELLADLHKQ